MENEFWYQPTIFQTCMNAVVNINFYPVLLVSLVSCERIYTGVCLSILFSRSFFFCVPIVGCVVPMASVADMKIQNESQQCELNIKTRVIFSSPTYVNAITEQLAAIA
jgi:hypothetical protein